jgi:NADPH2:quinone reductase
MRIIQVSELGGPEVLVPASVPDPVAGPGQVVVEAAACDVLYIDTAIRAGRGPFPVTPPYVPGNGLAGHVAAVGEGVDAGWLGRPVAASTGGPGGWGGYVSRALVPVENLIPVPDGLGPVEAAALLHDGRAAIGLLDRAPMRADTRVLITAAAGGAGSILVQLAHAAGAHVAAAVRGERKRRLVDELGADVVVDYGEQDWTGRLRDATGDFDVVFDGAGGEVGRGAFELTARDGWFCGWGAPGGGFATVGPEAARERGVHLHGIEQVQYAPDEGRGRTARALAEAAAGRIRPTIGQTFPLEKAADAHAAIAARTVVAKTLLIP